MKPTSLALVCSIIFALAASGQEREPPLPRIASSTVVADIEAKRLADRRITPQQLADFGNQRLKVVGFDFKTDPCDIESVRTEIGFPEAEYGEVFHIYPFQGDAGAKLELLAREPGDAPCGCWLDLPVRKAFKDRLEVITDKGAVEIGTKDLLVETVQLMDASLRRLTREWMVSDGGAPVGISIDGKKIYMDAGVQGLFLETADDGNLRFVPRTSPDIITAHVDLKRFPKDPDNDYAGFRRFTKGKVVYNVKFSHICA
jgi:hypothetical protein